MKKYQITIPRSETGGNKPILHTYTLELDDKEVFSIMDGLEYIYQYLDPTLAFFHHAACHEAVCAKCKVRVNGKPVLACKQQLTEGKLLLEPYGRKIIKDLIYKEG